MLLLDYYKHRIPLAAVPIRYAHHAASDRHTGLQMLHALVPIAALPHTEHVGRLKPFRGALSLCIPLLRIRVITAHSCKR